MSIPESVNCAAFTAGIIEAFLKGSNYVSLHIYFGKKYD